MLVGGGFSGAALTIHLLDTGVPDLRVTLVERRDSVGRGVAYGTCEPAHILNVPAARMSLDPGAPDAFVQYAIERGFDAGPTTLLPRSLYGDYVVAALDEACKRHPGRCKVVRSEATALDLGGVRLVDGSALPADAIVLATGHLPPLIPAGFDAEVRDDRRFVADAWEPGALDSFHPDERILVVGMGLTAVDVLLSLRARGWRGPVAATSRRGCWPLPHLPEVLWSGPPPQLPPALPVPSADGLFRWLRAAVRDAAERGVPWQAVIDSFRPQIPATWGALPHDERARFLRRYKHWWELHRHRAPIRSLATLNEWVEAGGLTVLPGQIRACVSRPEGLQITLDGRGVTRVTEVDRVVLCTGADTDLRRATNPILRSLLMEGRIATDPLGLGLEVSAEGRAIGVHGEPDPQLWVLGAARRPRLWEATAVPDLSRHAAALARAIAERPLTATSRAP